MTKLELIDKILEIKDSMDKVPSEIAGGIFIMAMEKAIDDYLENLK